jgi:hypothetical protein
MVKMYVPRLLAPTLAEAADGSQQFQLMANISESLAGRTIRAHLS